MVLIPIVVCVIYFVCGVGIANKLVYGSFFKFK